jgi:hypothetical protein
MEKVNAKLLITPCDDVGLSEIENSELVRSIRDRHSNITKIAEYEKQTLSFESEINS